MPGGHFSVRTPGYPLFLVPLLRLGGGAVSELVVAVRREAHAALAAGAGNFDEFRRTLSRSLGMVFLLTLPSSIGLIVLGKSMIGAICRSIRSTKFA